MSHNYPFLDREIAIGGLRARNRTMMATHGPRLSQARYLRYINERAKGGIAIMGFNVGILGSMAFPFGPGQATPDITFAEGDGVPPHPLTRDGRAYYDSLIPVARTWAEAAKSHGTLAIGQLFHAGSATIGDGLQPAVSASGVVDEYARQVPHILSSNEIADLIQSFAESARRARDAGYDMIELHGAHGYLIQQFLSPLTNLRSDAWGGPLKGRLRFLVEVLRASREAIRDALPVGLRLTGPEAPGGLTIDDVVEIAAAAETEGAAYVSISGGTYTGLSNGIDRAYVASAITSAGPNVHAATAVKAQLGIPVMVTGQITTMAQAEAIIAAGGADIIGMVRAIVAEPNLVAIGFQGGDPRPCINGNECHYGRPISCAVNPAAGREGVMESTPPVMRKRVLVIGAGPAGVECALAASDRGHDVVLAEKADEIGGVLRVLSQVSRQARFEDYIAYIERRLAGSRVDLRLGLQIDRATAQKVNAEVIVVATGASWTVPFGTSAVEALQTSEGVRKSTVVVGGLDDHLPPLVTALHLARPGGRLILLVHGDAAGANVEPASRFAMLRELQELKVEIRPFTAATALEGQRLYTRNTLTNERAAMDDVERVVWVSARTAELKLLEQLAGVAPSVRAIGDALSPRRMMHATLEGARMGLQI